MTAQPSPQQFSPLISGNVRTSDLVNSIAKEIDRITDHGTASYGMWSYEARVSALRALASKLRRLAETIERGEGKA